MPAAEAGGHPLAYSLLDDLAQTLEKFEPPVNVPVERSPVGGGREVLALCAESGL